MMSLTRRLSSSSSHGDDESRLSTNCPPDANGFYSNRAGDGYDEENPTRMRTTSTTATTTTNNAGKIVPVYYNNDDSVKSTNSSSRTNRSIVQAFRRNSNNTHHPHGEDVISSTSTTIHTNHIQPPSPSSPSLPVRTETVSWLQPPPSEASWSSRPHLSYIQHRSIRRFNLESTSSDFESDVHVQQATSKMLLERQQEQRLQHLEKSRRSTSSYPSSNAGGGGGDGGGRAEGGDGDGHWCRRWIRCSLCCPPPPHPMDSSSSHHHHHHDDHHHQRQPRRPHRFLMASKVPPSIVATFVFLVLVAIGVVVGIMLAKAQSAKIHEEAAKLSMEVGEFFAGQLDKAILPLFSMAQFAVHLQMFQVLPDQIGQVDSDGETGSSLPLNTTTWKRNITGVCDDPTLMATYSDIARTIKNQSGMDGILVNIQLAPSGVICLLHPLNNTEDFQEQGTFLDSTPVWGLDLFNDPSSNYIALQSITKDSVGVAGPLSLKQCPDCDLFFIARLPIIDDKHTIFVDGVPYPRWGFATGLISWTQLVNQSGVYETFEANQFEFQLTRTDFNQNTTTKKYEKVVVVLAETPTFRTKSDWKRVSTSLETTNNEWVMTVSYDRKPINVTIGIVIGSVALVALLISILIYTILNQKHEQEDLLEEGYDQETRLTTERNMTAYFAHELRNPLSAMDSALNSITMHDLPEETRDLLDSMQLCSSFMSSIMNNLLDVRKIEEGKMRIRAKPLSLAKFIENTHSMMNPLVRPGVEFKVEKNLPKGRNWVLGDEHRIQQVLTNVITNAIKYTLHGSITLSIYWQDHFVVLECTDTGPGIPKSEQNHMFERFVQRGGAPGTGLGLNIAQKIVNMMDGSIAFESDPTIAPGTTCRIMVPLLLCEEPEDESSSFNLSNSNNDANQNNETNRSNKDNQGTADGMIEEPISIMIIDDIKMNRVMLSRRIKKAIAPNARITLAETAEEALELCEKSDFDVIVCDQYMEEAGGVMVGTDGIIAMRRMNVTSYIIGCSGNDLDNEFFEAGANFVWGKPLPSNDEIIRQLRVGLKERQAMEASSM